MSGNGDGPAQGQPWKVGFFVTCLVDFFRPSVALAAISLLERAGCTVEVPSAQTCCGQPAYNSGDRRSATAIAKQVIPVFEPFDYVVVPSGSCGGMIKHHFPTLFKHDHAWHRRAADLAGRTYELTSFLVDVLGRADIVTGSWPSKVAYHDSCSGLRELQIKAQPRELLDRIDGLERVDIADSETCCGFGGAFCVKYPDVSNEMVRRKTDRIAASGADMLLAGDLGCLLNMAGKLARDGRPIAVRHVAEVLAGMDDAPPIGQGEETPE